MFEKLVATFPAGHLHPIPTLPKDLARHETGKFYFASKEPTDLLQSLDLKGFLLCEMPSDVRDTNVKKATHGNLYIPFEPDVNHCLDQVIIFKHISKLTENTFDALRDTITNQLRLLRSQLENLQQQQHLCVPPVKVVLLAVQKHSKATGMVVSQLSCHFKEELRQSIWLNVCFDRITTSNIENKEKVRRQLLKNDQFDQHSLLCWQSLRDNLASFILQFPSERVPQLTDKKFYYPNEDQQILCFTDDNNATNVHKLFKTFFPYFESQLEILPSINRIPSNLQNLQFNGADFCGSVKDADEYLGEVKSFWELFVSKLKLPTGLLIHSYRNIHSNMIMRENLKREFQFDWLLCSSKSGFTIFEVALCKNPNNPSCALKNKLIGQTVRQLFILRLILFSFLGPFWESGESELSSWIYGNTRLVVIFLNTTGKNLGDAIGELQQTNPVFKSQLPDVYILALEDLRDSSRIEVHKLLQLDQKENLVESSLRIEDIFAGSEKTDSHLHDTIQYATAMIAFSYLLNIQNPAEQQRDKLFIQQPCSLPLQPDHRFKNPIQCVNIILTPQQNRILKENPRNLFLMGEPGSGKTSVLLAKACQTAIECSDVDVFFVIPHDKTELREAVEKFVSHQASENERIGRIKCIRLADVLKAKSNAPSDDNVLTWKQLHKSILLIDELYFESTEKLAEVDKALVVLADMVYHAKQCWLINLQAGQMGLQKNIYRRCLVPNFTLAPLNILLRSAHHISFCSTNCIHRFKSFSRTSARVPGCFVSSQAKIPLIAFSHPNEINVENNSLVNSEFSSSRRIIIFSYRSEFWKKFGEVNNWDQLSVISPMSNYYSVPYTGCEWMSVIIVIDDLPNEVHDKRTFALINLALNRAQYEVCIFCDQEFTERMKVFLYDQNPLYEKSLYDSANNCKVSWQLGEFSKWDCETHKLVVKLIQMAIQTANQQLLDDLLDMYPGEDGQKPLPLAKILGAIDEPKPDTFMNYLTKRIGKQACEFFERLIWAQRFPKLYSRASAISQLIDFCITLGHIAIVDWYFSLLLKNNKTEKLRNFLIRYKRILFCACLNGKTATLKWAMDKLSSLSLETLKETELRSKHTLFFRENATLLLTLCYARCELGSVQLIFDEGFPDDLLLEKYLDKNALQFAIDYEDKHLAELLLENPERRRVFLNSQTNYGSFSSPEEYANSLCFYEMADLIKNFRL